ncbi:MAG: hypothetical protein IJ816_05245 [Alloprevotella sp.]|nr:hypothetical protein [Alloprevotella sp.]
MLTILKPQDFSCKLKATVQSSGKLNFTDATAQELGLEKVRSVKFALDEQNNLYIALLSEKVPDAFLLCRSGRYYYVQARLIFNSLGIDYVNNTVICDLRRYIEADEEMVGKAYKLIIRVKPQKGKEDVGEV